MHIVEQNVEDDNIEELIMKQANTNMAKQILKKLEMRMKSSQNIPNKNKEQQELNRRVMQGILDQYEYEQNELIKSIGITKFNNREMANVLA